MKGLRLQAIGTTVPCYFSATVSTPGDSVTYSLNAAPYSTYFTLVATGTPCLKVAQVMTYESVTPTTVFNFSECLFSALFLAFYNRLD